MREVLFPVFLVCAVLPVMSRLLRAWAATRYTGG
jgi:hypothetical protein